MERRDNPATTRAVAWVLVLALVVIAVLAFVLADRRADPKSDPAPAEPLRVVVVKVPDDATTALRRRLRARTRLLASYRTRTVSLTRTIRHRPTVVEALRLA